MGALSASSSTVMPPIDVSITTTGLPVIAGPDPELARKKARAQPAPAMTRRPMSQPRGMPVVALAGAPGSPGGGVEGGWLDACFICSRRALLGRLIGPLLLRRWRARQLPTV